MTQFDAARRRGTRLRVALYSHDTQGLGHIRRNTALAAALVRAQPDAAVLLVSGSPHAGAFRSLPNVQLLALPAVRKSADGSYQARAAGKALGDVVSVRTEVLSAALGSFDPDVVVVDKVPRGFDGELQPALSRLRERGRARLVLGLRDILDAPAAARLEWARDDAGGAIDAYYDEVWVYGDRDVYDPVVEYAWPASVARKVRFTGYLARRTEHAVAPAVRGGVPFALCLVGGGQDGYPLARTFLAAPLPAGWEGVVVTGPEMPADEHDSLQLAANGSGRHVRTFVEGCEELLAQAGAVVSMGGYNSVCEILAANIPALVVPRVRPRLEQYVRAERLARRGLLSMLEPDELSTQTLGSWLSPALSRATSRPSVARRSGLDLDGLARFPEFVTQLVAQQEVRRVG